MGRFNLDDYSPVEERIGLFYGDHPNGRILTEIVRLEPPLCVVKASVYRDADAVHPWATGFAYEKEGDGHVNQTSYVENCETSAIGRALANAGYHGKRDGAPRPSREEMAKVERMTAPASAAQEVQKAQNTPRTAPDGFNLDTVAPGKKANGRTWKELLTTEDGRGFVRWAVENMGTLSTVGKDALRAALEGPVTQIVLLENELTKAIDLDIMTPDQITRIQKVIEKGDPDEVRISLDWTRTQVEKKRLGS